MIIGQPGSGKSTLARQMGEATHLPVVHIDLIHWKTGWVERTRRERMRCVPGCTKTSTPGHNFGSIQPKGVLVSMWSPTMTILRLPVLTFSVLWRLMLVLPVLLIIYGVLIALTIAMMILSVTNLPILVLPLGLVMGGLGLAITLHPLLVGTKMGLEVLGIKCRASTTDHVKAAVGYGLIQALMTYIVAAGVTLAYFLIRSGELRLNDAMNVNAYPDPSALLFFSYYFGESGLMTDGLMMSAIILLLGLCIQTAFLPALAGAAAGRDPRSQTHTPFNGLGAHFLPLLGLMLLLTLASAVLVPLLAIAASSFGIFDLLADLLQDVMSFALAEPSDDPVAESPLQLATLIYFVAALFVAALMLGLQCAAAALSYQARAERANAIRATRQQADAADPADIRALMQSRMPNLQR